MHDVRETDHIKLLGDNGIQLTQGLFVEFSPEAPYTMQVRDKQTKNGHTAISAYRVYMESVDEYDAAMRLVGNLEHWRKLCGLKWFREGIAGVVSIGLDQWREDMAMRDASTAKEQLIKNVQSSNVNASKFLYEASTKKKAKDIKQPKEEGESTALAIFKQKSGG